MSRFFGVVLLIAACSCQTTGMSFTSDDRLTIEAPSSRQLVRLPVEVRWEPSRELVADMQDSDGEKFFAVFVDRPPIRGGSDISSFVDSDCRRTPGCGDEEWFYERGIYFTTGDRVTIDDVDDLRRDSEREDRDLHRATVVVMQRAEEPELDTAYDGTRDGEGAITVEFWVDRREEDV